jgi:hypothetical protein
MISEGLETSEKEVYALSVPYALNIDKQLGKTLSAARQPVNFKIVEKGGNYVVEADAANFEAFRSACKCYYDYIKHSSDVKVTTENKEDLKGNLVQVIWWIEHRRSELFTYTLNFYTTKCSCMLNGKTLWYSLTTIYLE